MKRTSTVTGLLVILVLTGCEYEVPITAQPTREIESSLLGEWTSAAWTDQDCKDRLRVRKYDDSSYVFSYNDTMYRAWHSDVGETPFMTVQNLDSSERKFLYFAWSLTEGGKHLVLKQVKPDVFSKTGADDSASVVAVLRANSNSTDLFDDAATFIRKR